MPTQCHLGHRRLLWPQSNDAEQAGKTPASASSPLRPRQEDCTGGACGRGLGTARPMPHPEGVQPPESPAKGTGRSTGPVHPHQGTHRERPSVPTAFLPRWPWTVSRHIRFLPHWWHRKLGGASLPSHPQETEQPTEHPASVSQYPHAWPHFTEGMDTVARDRRHPRSPPWGQPTLPSQRQQRPRTEDRRLLTSGGSADGPPQPRGQPPGSSSQSRPGPFTGD